MADWDEEEAKYLANPEKYIENLGKELDLQRESQTRSEIATQNNIKWTRPKIGIRRNYYERYQRGFYQTLPPKGAKRLACPTGTITPNMMTENKIKQP